MIKNILGRIMALWALIVFLISMFLVLLPIWIFGFFKEPKSTQLFHTISKTWIQTFFFFIGCNLKVKGKNYFEKNKTYIVICNHNSFIDIPVSTPFIPGANKTIAKIEMSKIPLFGIIYKRGSVLVDRKNKNSRQQSFTAMKQVLNTGLHMCIYPEGTRNKTDKPLGEFHNGAFRLAMETQTDIIPALIFNTKKILPANKTFYFWPSKIELHFLKSVSSKDFENFEDLKEQLHTLMTKYYQENLKK